MTDVEKDAPSTVSVTIDGTEIAADPGELLIAAAERTGTYIPRFCYHPRMEPVGMCRMCIVEVDTGRGPALQPACMLPVTDGMVVETESEVTKKAQDGVLEFLLINHPLDCPVCDKGGECPLQDQTMAYGPGESRFVEEKRHFEKPIPISDLVNLDRERCILCDRCTRFASEVAGDPLIAFIDRGNQTQVNTFPDHEFASYFSGNTVQICPVGALTATPYRFKARPWDLDQAESTCTTCSVGCRVVVQSSRNEVLRYQGVDVDPVNWGWLCDKGRFAFQAVNDPERLGEPLVRRGDSLEAASWSDALGVAATAIRGALDGNGPGGIGVVGGSQLTNEDAYAWAKLAKGVIGTDHVDAQLGDGLPAEIVLGLPRATIDDVCAPDGTVLLMTGDLKEELPVLYLRLRHAVEHDRVRVVELTSVSGPTSGLAETTLVHRPGEADLVVAALLGEDPPPADTALAERDVAGVTAAEVAAARALLEAGSVSVVLGRPNPAESADAAVAAAAAIHEADPSVRFLPALRRGNVAGAMDMGLAPGLLPGRVTLDAGRAWYVEAGWPTAPAERGLDTVGILTAAAEGRLDVLVLLGADPLGDLPDRDLAIRAMAGARTVVALDGVLTGSSRHADVVLPVAGFAEVAGTTTNLEGRVSTLAQKVTPPGTARSDWMIAAELARLLGADLGLTSVEAIWDEIERLAPSHTGLTRELLAHQGSHDGIVVPLGAGPAPDAEPSGAPETGVAPEAAEATVAAEAAPGGEEQAIEEVAAVEAQADQATEEAIEEAAAEEADIEDAAEAAEGTPDLEGTAARTRPALLVLEAPQPRKVPAVDAYSLRLVATRKLYDLGVAVQRSPALAPLAKGAGVRLHPHDFDRLGIDAGTPVTLTSPRGSITLTAERDPAVARGAAAVVLNQPGPAVADLVDATAPVTEVRVERS
jgi:NADH-quinone oxidoreductase subunit G